MKDTQEILDQIEILKKFYKNKREEKFLVLEEYRENHESKKITYLVEIKDYDEKQAERDFSNEELDQISKNLSIKRRTNLANGTTNKIHVILKGTEVVDRLDRLYRMVKLMRIQPPGMLAGGLPHETFSVSEFDLLLTVNGSIICCDHPVDRLTNARYLASKTVESDVKALQCILHNLQYDDEMEWDRFKTDGFYLARTRAAVKAFVEEVNFVDHGMEKRLAPDNGEFVTADIANELVKKCKQGWQRPPYYKLTDPKWDYSTKSIKTKEGIWRSRYHVRQLQKDLKSFGFDPTIDKTGKSNPKLLDGLFGVLTETSLKKFQDAAAKGIRFDTDTQSLISTGTVTFKGSINGILDKETKEEIGRWLPTCDPHDADWQKWFDQSAVMQKVRHGNRVISLIDGGPTFQEMVNVMATATGKDHYIYTLNWWADLGFELTPGRNPYPGATSSRLGDILSAAVSNGVQVRAMFWDQVGNQNTPEVNRINSFINRPSPTSPPLADGAAILDNNTLNLGSHHQKILIVKGIFGLIGFCGGVDFNSDRISHVTRQPGSPMHDVHCLIDGPAAWDLLQIFQQRWTDHPDSLKLETDKTNPKETLRSIGESIPPTRGNLHVQIGRTFGNGSRHRGIKNSNGQSFYTFAPNGEQTAQRMIFNAIAQSQKFIYIEDQYLVSMDASNRLRAQIPQLERLIILIAHSSISDHPNIWRFRKNFIDNLMSAPNALKKVIICYRKPSGTSPDPKRVLPGTNHTYIHAKTWIFDDKFAIIGSANCNNRGYTHDSEVVAGIFDESAEDDCRLYFAHDLRIKLWMEHLNLKRNDVIDPISSSHYWEAPTITSSIARYDQNADTDSTFNPNNLVPDTTADPIGS